VVHGAFFYWICLSCGLYFELFVSAAHTYTKQHYIIPIISFTYQKVDKGTSQQVTALVKHMKCKQVKCRSWQSAGPYINLTGHDQLDLHCLGLSYVKGGAILGHNKHLLSMKTKYQVPLSQSIDPFSSSATNISIYHVLLIVPWVLHNFAPYGPWHNLQQFKYSNKSTVYIFLPSLCASCFCTVYTLHLIKVRLKMWMGENLACQYASRVYSKQNKAHEHLLSRHWL